MGNKTAVKHSQSAACVCVESENDMSNHFIATQVDHLRHVCGLGGWKVWVQVTLTDNDYAHIVRLR